VKSPSPFVHCPPLLSSPLLSWQQGIWSQSFPRKPDGSDVYTSSVFERDLDTSVDSNCAPSQPLTHTVTCSATHPHCGIHSHALNQLHYHQVAHIPTHALNVTHRPDMHACSSLPLHCYVLAFAPMPEAPLCFSGWLVVCSYLRSVANGYDGGRGCPDVGRVRERLANYDFTTARAYVPCSPRSLAHVCLWES
jgi:hypothetical protein